MKDYEKNYPVQITPEIIRAATRDAIKQFLDEKFAQFGKWSLASVMAMFLAAIVYFTLRMHGWHK